MVDKKEELAIAYSEAYDFYNLIPDEDKKRVPQKFVKEMKKCSRKELLGKIKDFSDMNKNIVSREGAKKIAYISLFI